MERTAGRTQLLLYKMLCTSCKECIISFLKSSCYYIIFQYLASGSSSVPKNTSVTSSLLQILHRGGHVSPQKPMHGCLHGSSFSHGSLQGSLSQNSKHNFLQRRCLHAQSQGSCNMTTLEG